MCQKSFKKKWTLKTHMLQQHKSTETTVEKWKSVESKFHDTLLTRSIGHMKGIGVVDGMHCCLV